MCDLGGIGKVVGFEWCEKGDIGASWEGQVVATFLVTHSNLSQVCKYANSV